MKLRKLPEPALSREFTGEVIRKKALFCPCERPGVSTVASHMASQSQGPSEAAASLAQLWGKEFSLCSHVAPSVEWDLSTLSLMDQQCSSQSSSLTLQVDFLPDQISVGPLRRKRLSTYYVPGTALGTFIYVLFRMRLRNEGMPYLRPPRNG